MLPRSWMDAATERCKMTHPGRPLPVPCDECKRATDVPTPPVSEARDVCVKEYQRIGGTDAHEIALDALIAAARAEGHRAGVPPEDVALLRVSIEEAEADQPAYTIILDIEAAARILRAISPPEGRTMPDDAKRDYPACSHCKRTDVTTMSVEFFGTEIPPICSACFKKASAILIAKWRKEDPRAR